MTEETKTNETAAPAKKKRTTLQKLNYRAKMGAQGLILAAEQILEMIEEDNPITLCNQYDGVAKLIEVANHQFTQLAKHYGAYLKENGMTQSDARMLRDAARDIVAHARAAGGAFMNFSDPEETIRRLKAVLPGFSEEDEKMVRGALAEAKAKREAERKAAN